jgi:hypothetical protein
VTGLPTKGWRIFVEDENGNKQEKILRGEDFVLKMVEENGNKFNSLSGMKDQDIYKDYGIRRLNND